MAHNPTGSSFEGEPPAVVKDAVMASYPEPIHWDATEAPSPGPDDIWGVYSYKDVSMVLNDHAAVSRQMAPMDYHGSPGIPRIVWGYWGLDNPWHGQLQRIIAPQFSPVVVRRRFGAIIPEEVDRAIDAIIDSGEGSFTYPETIGRIPLNVMARYTGMDPGDPVVAAWISANNKKAQTPEQEAAAYAKFLELLEARKRDFPEGEKPRSPVDALVAAQRAGHIVLDAVLTDEWATEQLAMLRAAGDDTTATMLGNTLQGFSEHGVFEQLKAEPALLPGALIEAERHWPSFPKSFGTARHNLTVGQGPTRQTIPAGAVIDAWLTAANRDPNVFTNPHTFDPQREQNQHLTFSDGWRSCTGAYLARTIVKETVTSVIRRLPGIQWDGQRFQRERGFVYTIPPAGEAPTLRFVFNPDRAN